MNIFKQKIAGSVVLTKLFISNKNIFCNYSKVFKAKLLQEIAMLKEIKIKVTHQQNNIMKEYALAFEIAVAKAAKGLDKIKIAQQIMDIDIIKTELPLCLIDKAIKVHKDIGRCSYNSFQLEKPCFEILDRSIKIPYIGWIDVGTEIESDSITFLSIGNNIWSLRYVPITQKVEVQYV